jgi:hypothetical protein
MKAHKEEVFVFGWINVVIRNHRPDDSSWRKIKEIINEIRSVLS